ncbi:hypothetical protein EDC96DRAFT_609463 [Choanephora cucurbitarum]|nr:hypothetical protein EDC96DRAFT_609463 [Choanephora cucurbitarum]
MNKTMSSNESSLIHRLYLNERQLRTLVVILSLAGGLALSFLLGVIILICWYSQRQKESDSHKITVIPTLTPSLQLPEPSAPSAKEIDLCQCLPPPAYTSIHS